MHKILWILTAAVFTALLLPVLVQEGMFLDGVSYACIARNMANGLGDLAYPHYTATLYPICYEQPPLALWMQSLFFSVFGDAFWVERLYSFCMAIGTVCGIVLNWNLLATQTLDSPIDNKKKAWLPVILWLAAPIVFWGYQNNMLECTMSFFVLLSSFFAAKSVLEKKPGLLIIATFFTAVAVLSKGPVGFFPVAVPIAMSMAFEPKGLLRASGRSLFILGLSLALLGLFIATVPGMPEYLDYYLSKQLLPTLSGAREKQVENPFSFLIDLGSQLVLPGILLVALYAKPGFRSVSLPKSALFFLLAGLAGSLPLVFTPKQSTHYLLPSIPFFALGFSVILSHNLSWNISFLNKQRGRLTKIAYVVLVVTIVTSLSFWGKYRRNASQIRDIKVVCKLVGADQVMGVPQHFSSDWLLIAYFGRLGNISLDSRTPHDFWLMEKGGNAPEGYKKLETEITGYELWKKL